MGKENVESMLYLWGPDGALARSPEKRRDRSKEKKNGFILHLLVFIRHAPSVLA